MDFRYTEEQLALQETLQRFIARDYDFEQRRALARSPLGYSPQAWAQYAELGLLALPLPEEYGGLGGNAVDVMVVMEQVGQGLLLEPYLSTVVLCGGLLAAMPAPQRCKQALLPRIAAGKVQAGAGSLRGGRALRLCATSRAQAIRGRRRAGGCRARKTVVLDAPSADCFLVSARTSGAAHATPPVSRCSWCRATAAGSHRCPLPDAVAARRAADLQLADVAVGCRRPLIGRRARRWRSWSAAVDAARAALCAEALRHRQRPQPGDARLPEEPQAVRRADRDVPGAAAPHGRHVHRRGADPLDGDHCRGRRLDAADAPRASARHLRRPRPTSARRRASSASRRCSCMGHGGGG